MARQEQLDALCAELWPDKPKKTPEPTPAVEEGKPSKNFDEAMLNRMRTCLTEIDKMKVADKGDGSNRLFAACCR